MPKYVKAGKLKGNLLANVLLRTTVSRMDTPREKIAELGEHELRDFVESTPGYIRDTTDFIEKPKEKPDPLPSDAILFSFDVYKLYPSIPKKEGLEACKEVLLKRSDPIVKSATKTMFKQRV